MLRIIAFDSIFILLWSAILLGDQLSCLSWTNVSVSLYVTVLKPGVVEVDSMLT